MTAQNHDDAAGPPWNALVGGGPITATAIHAGHVIRPDLAAHLAIGDEDRRREEDPLTDYFLSLADNLVRVNRSRFECDMNRARAKAISNDPADTWGLTIWKDDLPAAMQEQSRELHDRFYAEMRAMFDALLEQHERIVVFDLHSYNHRRDGADADPAPAKDNPDIDIGATTLDKAVYGGLLDKVVEELRGTKINGQPLEVHENVRYPDGGNFPEWLCETYGRRACVMTLEHKKIFMDEWTGTLDIGAAQDLRTGMMAAMDIARRELARIAA
ncbi:MAG: N-formylglutamate amidohydrolase [Pontixanthobacter sp.]